jgi:putative ABC transport system permease protein
MFSQYQRELLKDWLAKRWTVLKLDLSLAARNVLRQRRRSAIGLSAIASGVVALLLAAGFFEWNYDSMREGTIRARIGHIIVSKPGYLESGAADPFRYLIPERNDSRDLIEQFPQVDTVAPRLAFNGLISVGESTVSFMGDGVDPERERKLAGALKLTEGSDLSAADAKEVIVGEGLAHNLGIKTGDTVVLVANTQSGGVNALEVKVAGIFSTIIKAYDDFALRLPLKTAQGLVRTEGVHSWLVLLHKTSQTDRTIKRIREKVPAQELQLTPWYETAAADFYNKTVSLFSKQVLVVKLMIAFIIILSISNTMMTNVRDRTGEIGTCMALGDTRRTVLRRFLVEGLVLGFVGGTIGVVVGIGLAQVISDIGIPMPPPPGVASSYIAGILVTPWLVLDALLLSVVTAFLAGVFPAWKASRLSIVDALRHAR